MPTDQGFLSSLFDLSFRTWVTPRIIKVIYVLTLALIGLAALVFVIAAFQNSATAGIFTLLIGAPVVSLIYAIYARVMLEFVMAVFRIAETNQELVALRRSESQPTPAAPLT